MLNDAPLVIDVRGINKRFGTKHVVKDLALQVRQGEIFGFLGPNGSGKTTTIRMLCGLLQPDEGEGRCLGLDIRTQARQIKRRVGYMTQRFGLYDDLSIAENLDFVARAYGMADRRALVQRTLDRLGLATRRTQLAGTLSGGWKQRLALAACMLHQPELLLLDEPTAGVDPSARRDFWQQIHALAADGLTVLVSTHYMDEAERCHRLAYISYGRLLATGSADEVVRQSGLNTWELRGVYPRILDHATYGEQARKIFAEANELPVSEAILYPDANRAEAEQHFTAYAKAIAALSFCEGGVPIFGRRWESRRPPTPNGARAVPTLQPPAARGRTPSIRQRRQTR